MAAESGLDFDGFLSWSISLATELRGVNEEHVLQMGESFTSHNRRAEIDVNPRNLPEATPAMNFKSSATVKRDSDVVVKHPP